MNNQIKLYLKRLIRKSFTFNKALKKLEKSQYYTKAELDNFQNHKLYKIIRHCYKNVPYYTDLFRELNLKPEDITIKEDLKKLPFMDKHTVIDNYDKLIARNIPRFLTYNTHTSGTTGTPGKVLWDINSLNYEYATINRFYRNAGDKGLKRLTLRGLLVVPVSQNNPPFWKYNKTDNELIMSSYHFNKKNAQLYIEEINKFNPKILNAYPSTAFLLANYIKELNHKLSLKAVFTSSETISDFQREVIENTFGCPVYDWYGQVERVAAIGQCEKGTYHINEDYSIVETVESQFGTEIVGTHLHNYAMPFLRYKTADIVELSDNKCPCGSNFRTVSKISGKSSSYYHIITNDGAKITSFGYIVMGVNNIIETQFIQEKAGELIVKVVTNGKFTEEDKQKLISNALERTSPDMKIIVNEVNEIQRGPNGKFAGIINKLIDTNQESIDNE